jgi:serine/threonine protein kinase
VHRDLSARNVLVAVTPGISTELTALGTPVNAVCKVADFGLSRGVGSEDYYRMGDNSSPIPIRWMAPETLRHGTSSTEGDVWSFAVFLWEVYSLGCRPYPALNNGEIQGHIEAGGRLPQPKLCPWAAYELMAACWALSPASRPGFGAVAEAISEMCVPVWLQSDRYGRNGSSCDTDGSVAEQYYL